MSDENQQDEKFSLEETFERGLFASRWLMAPMYLGLVFALAMLTFIFCRELLYYMPQVLTMSSDKSILVVLTLIDLTLAANLLLIVLFSGYENFVSKMDISKEQDKPDWMGTVDFSGLKMKLIASIVAISAGFVAQIVVRMSFPLPQTDSCYGHGTRNAKRCEAV
jgi:uncharacterized protein (TIGR00645 family)